MKEEEEEEAVGGHISFLGQVLVPHCQVAESLFV